MSRQTDDDIRLQVARMKLEGKRYAEICEALDISPSAVGRHMRELQRIATEALEDDAKTIRLIEEARLETATNALWPDVCAGDTKAVDSWIKVHNARAKLWRLDEIPAGDSVASIKNKLRELLTKS